MQRIGQLVTGTPAIHHLVEIEIQSRHSELEANRGLLLAVYEVLLVFSIARTALLMVPHRERMSFIE
jgi:hypothetical protein